MTATTMAQRLLSAVLFGMLLAATSTLAFTSPQYSAVNVDNFNSTLEGIKTKHVLLRESEGYHDEVWVPFLTDLGASPFVRTTFSRVHARWNMGSIADLVKFENPIHRQGSGYNDSKQFDLTPEQVIEHKIDTVITVSCDADFFNHPEVYQRLYHQTDVKVLCCQHDTHPMSGTVKYYENITKLWIDSKRITFLVLGEHVGKNLQKNFIIKGSKPIDYEIYVPVFDLPRGLETQNADLKEKSFVIQGNFESTRRNYNLVFQHLREGLMALPRKMHVWEKPKLVLIGSGKPMPVPQDLTLNVDVHANVEYPEFYKTLSKSAAVVPAFAVPTYYYEKASSTINAAIIAGTVIIGNTTMIEQYGFLNDQIVFKMNPNESDVQAAIRYLSLDKKIRNERLNYIRSYRHDLISKNRALLNRLINPSAVAEWQAQHRTNFETVAHYWDAAREIPVDHPHSSMSGFAVLIMLVTAFVFRRFLVRQYRSLKTKYLENRRPSNGNGEYVPVSIGNEEPSMRSVA